MRNFIIALFAVFALVLTGCATQGPATEPNPEASVAQPVQKPAEVPKESKPADKLKTFGDVMTWHDGVSISVSEPTPFEPTPYSSGAVDGQTNVIYTLVLTNATDKPLEPLVMSSVSSGGAEASAIFDMGNPIGDIGSTPTTVILPGQTVKWLEAYSLVDPNSVTFQVSPTFMYDKAVFTNIK